jgi:hypothetical protein
MHTFRPREPSRVSRNRGETSKRACARRTRITEERNTETRYIHNLSSYLGMRDASRHKLRTQKLQTGSVG